MTEVITDTELARLAQNALIMCCSSPSGTYEVRIRFDTLEQAQEFHAVLVDTLMLCAPSNKQS